MKEPSQPLLRALLKLPVERTPIWIMRQAGRYLPEYRQRRAEAGDFLTLCKTPALAAEVTLQPLRRFDLDAAIIFSDILTIPDSMGLGLYFAEGEGPRFKYPITCHADVLNLPVPDVATTLHYVPDALRLVKEQLDPSKTLIGFAGSPWTLATYMVEGGATKNFSKVKGMLYSSPETLALLLEKLVHTTIDYLNTQIEAGAQAVMLFDTWGGVLTPLAYNAFSLEPMQAIIAGLHKTWNDVPVPVIAFTKQGGQWLENIAAIGCHAVGVDWTVDIADARRRIGHQVALQGNMDPCVLYGGFEAIEAEVKTILDAFGPGNGHVFNLGHGIHPQIEPEKVAWLVEKVHEYSSSQT